MTAAPLNNEYAKRLPATHTPGPWMMLPETGTGRVGQFCILTKEGPRLDIASTYGWPDTPIEANARLIVAAPDLLAAAKAVVDACNPLPLKSEQHIAFAHLTNAINKAEGRS